MKRHSISTEKTARYFSIGETGPHVKQVLFACHGYAQLADEFLAGFESIAREDLLIIAPEGLHRFYARGGADKVVASWMTKEDREDDIRDYVSFLDKVFETVMREVPAAAKISVLGFSQGAATVSRWLSMGKSRADELILFCGFFPPDLPASGIPAEIALTVVTASEDKFSSPEQENAQLEMMRAVSPAMKHIRFEGKHEIDAATLKKLMA